MLPFLGAAASATFSQKARQAKGVIVEMISVKEDPQRAAGLKRAFKGIQRACFQCHNIRSHELGWKGPLVWPGIDERFDEYGVRRDLFRVGMDVWSPPGEKKAVQKIANAVNAGLLLVGATK